MRLKKVLQYTIFKSIELFAIKLFASIKLKNITLNFSTLRETELEFIIN